MTKALGSVERGHFTGVTVGTNSTTWDIEGVVELFKKNFVFIGVVLDRRVWRLREAAALLKRGIRVLRVCPQDRRRWNKRRVI